MFNCSHVEGLKFPDEMVVRFFFKNKLDRRRGRVIELGCGNANNLMLFAAYGWDVVGVDFDEAALTQARAAFAGYQFTGQFFNADLSVETTGWGSDWDVVLIPNFINYVSRTQALNLLRSLSSECKQERIIFVRYRRPQDYRFGRGKQIGENSFKLMDRHTGEIGTIQSFYEPHEMLDMLGVFGSADWLSLNVDYDNPQGSRKIRNCDGVIWGTCINGLGDSEFS